MRYEWEEELMPLYQFGGGTEWKVQHHLKKVWDKDPLSDKFFAHPLSGKWKVTVAWVTKVDKRKWDCQFVNHDGNRTFRSLKAAKAYALAIITLEQ